MLPVMAKKRNNISVQDIAQDHASYVDPHGFVFHYKDAVYRCVYPASVPLFKQLIESDLYNELVEKHHLVNTDISDMVIKEHPDAMVLSHEKIWPLSYPVEWAPSMWYDAARATLELAITLTEHDLMLQDAYPWNVLFKGSQPVFVDFTSISSVDHKALWPAHEQYEAFFLRPLILSKQGKGFCARNMMYDYINGISFEHFIRLLDTGYRVRHPGLYIASWLDKKLQHSTKVKEKLRTMTENSMKNTTPAIRKGFLKKLMKRLGDRPVVQDCDPWKDYYAEIETYVDKDQKLKAVGGMVQRLSPDTVLDIGCNTGVFSIEAAKRGARVVSLDSSESCIEQLYAISRQQNLSITPLIADITSPTPAFGYMSEQYPEMLDRVRSDCVLFLGIMHHIHVSGRQSFERIARMLDKVSHKHVIFEFVSMEDANMPHLSQRREVNYDEAVVRQALGAYFSTIDTYPSDRDTRSLLLCSK